MSRPGDSPRLDLAEGPEPGVSSGSPAPDPPGLVALSGAAAESRGGGSPPVERGRDVGGRHPRRHPGRRSVTRQWVGSQCPAAGDLPATQTRGASSVIASCQWPVGSAQWRTAELPGGGQQNCPVVANRTARWWPTELPGVHLVSGVTPLPAVAWVRRMLSPAVMTTWAWCSNRSTVALAMVLGMSSSNPAG